MLFLCILSISNKLVVQTDSAMTMWFQLARSANDGVFHHLHFFQQLILSNHNEEANQISTIRISIIFYHNLKIILIFHRCIINKTILDRNHQRNKTCKQNDWLRWEFWFSAWKNCSIRVPSQSPINNASTGPRVSSLIENTIKFAQKSNEWWMSGRRYSY